MNRTRLIVLAAAALVIAARMCHVHILWEGDTLPIAAAGQMLEGKVLYRDIWFDKPPLVPLFYLLCGARPGWPLRLLDAGYVLLAGWVAYRFARDSWSKREGFWAAGLLAFFLTFDFPSAVIPVASDLLMLAPHMAAVWLARRRPFWSGVLAGTAFWISPKGVFVLLACVVWNPGGTAWMAAGFAAASGLGTAGLLSAGSLPGYWDEVWRWGRLYAESTFFDAPLRNGLVRTVNWMGFHAAAVIAAAWLVWKGGHRYRWLLWLALSIAGAGAGLRFFPRYYLQVLPVVVLMASRGFVLIGPRRELAALLLLIPLTRFGPTYVSAFLDPAWRDIGMDRDSRNAAARVRALARPGETLFVWGYRPEIYAYTQMRAATMYLDSQPLTGVPADRHLTRSTPIETVEPARRRTEVAKSRPDFIVDGLGLLNPRLAIPEFPELRDWFAQYEEVRRTGQSVIYRPKR